MSTKRVVLVAAVILVAGTLAAFAIQSAKTEKEQERELSLKELPPAVKATILKEAGDHTILEIEEIRLGDKLYYEAEWLEGGKEIEIKVAPDGTLLGKFMEEPDDEDDEEDEEENDCDDD